MAASAGRDGLDLGDVYSVELWLRNSMENDARAVTGYLLSRGPDGADGAPGDHLGIGGTHSSTGRLFFYNGNHLAQSSAGGTRIPKGTWNHVVLIRQGEDVRVHLNGRKEPEFSGRAKIGYPAQGSGQVFIGGRNDNFANFTGRIDQVAVYDRPLRPEEFAAHYAASGLPPPGNVKP